MKIRDEQKEGRKQPYREAEKQERKDGVGSVGVGRGESKEKGQRDRVSKRKAGQERRRVSTEGTVWKPCSSSSSSTFSSCLVFTSKN